MAQQVPGVEWSQVTLNVSQGADGDDDGDTNAGAAEGADRTAQPSTQQAVAPGSNRNPRATENPSTAAP